MTLLVDQLKKDLKEMEKEFEEKVDSLRTSLSEDTLTDVLNESQDQQQELTQQLKELKIKKFNQVKKEKQEGRTYFWRSSESRSDRWYTNTRRPQRMQASDSSSLCSSTTSSWSFLSVSRRRLDLKRHQKGNVHHRPDRERGTANRGPWTRSRTTTRK